MSGFDGNGIDRYEAQSIAEGAARTAASEAERNVGYQIQRLEDDIRSLRLQIQEEREARQDAVNYIGETIDDLRARLAEVTP